MKLLQLTIITTALATVADARPISSGASSIASSAAASPISEVAPVHLFARNSGNPLVQQLAKRSYGKKKCHKKTHEEVKPPIVDSPPAYGGDEASPPVDNPPAYGGDESSPPVVTDGYDEPEITGGYGSSTDDVSPPLVPTSTCTGTSTAEVSAPVITPTSTPCTTTTTTTPCSTTTTTTTIASTTEVAAPTIPPAYGY